MENTRYPRDLPRNSVLFGPAQAEALVMPGTPTKRALRGLDFATSSYFQITTDSQALGPKTIPNLLPENTVYLPDSCSYRWV